MQFKKPKSRVCQSAERDLGFLYSWLPKGRLSSPFSEEAGFSLAADERLVYYYYFNSLSEAPTKVGAVYSHKATDLPVAYVYDYTPNLPFCQE